MSYNLFKVLLLMLLISYLNALPTRRSRVRCPPDFCKSFDCPSVRCAENEHVKEKGDFCGCCDTCALDLYKGDLCFAPLIGLPDGFECAKGLFCNIETKLCDEMPQSQTQEVV
nr:uncharacterized protein LOC107438465 [Parasteatoda tepidariorum]XP_015906257.2 uncharacterized protein LOC107438465 [Parasteatoda tepidariorum]XP_042906800.1 uncharacterized protein LOC107438465 [Parasteatoda tepidariorum]XP_042906801.1 uncharacterized protein LOC107438465 [Parasteatoda tepidariorum]